MKNKITGIRGIDPKVYEAFKKKVCVLHDGKSRGKHSFVAEELNYLMQLFVETNGRLTGNKKGLTRKEQILRDAIEELEKEFIKHPGDRTVHQPAMHAAIMRAAARHRLYPDQRTLKSFGFIFEKTFVVKDEHGIPHLPPLEKLEITYPSMFG